MCSKSAYLYFESRIKGATGTDGRPGTIRSNSAGILFASVISAMMNRAMCAKVEMVSVRSRLIGFSKSRRTGR